MEININEIDARIKENEEKKATLSKDVKGLIVLGIGQWVCTIGIILLTVFSRAILSLFVIGIICSLWMIAVSFLFVLGIYFSEKEIENHTKLLDILYDIRNLNPEEKQNINNVIIQDGE